MKLWRLIFSNTIPTCCWDEHFPSHLTKPWQMTWQKLVILRKLLICLVRTQTLCQIYILQLLFPTLLPYTFQKQICPSNAKLTNCPHASVDQLCQYICHLETYLHLTCDQEHCTQMTIMLPVMPMTVQPSCKCWAGHWPNQPVCLVLSRMCTNACIHVQTHTDFCIFAHLPTYIHTQFNIQHLQNFQFLKFQISTFFEFLDFCFSRISDIQKFWK